MFPFLIATAILTVVSASAQTPAPDPYNPQTQRNPTLKHQVDPNLLDLGTGTDQGNIGPFGGAPRRSTPTTPPRSCSA